MDDELCLVQIQIPSYLVRKLHESSESTHGSKDFCENIVLNAIIDLLEKSTQHHTASLLYNGGIPRKDVLDKLIDIRKFLKLLDSYPNLSPPAVRNAIKQNVGKDSRTFKNYMDCIRPHIIMLCGESGIGQIWNTGEFVKAVENEFLSR